MKEFAKGFYEGKAWRRCREDFIAKRINIDGGMCQRCKKELGYIVHHKIELTADNINDATVSLNHNNLMFLCTECHNKTHGWYQNKRRTIFDEDGNVLPADIPYSNFEN